MRWILPLGQGSFHNDIECLYTLRGINKFHPSAEVTIIGEKPVWYKGDHIPYKENPLMCKEAKIFMKVLEAAKHYDEFVFTNDDHFLLAPFDGRNYAQYNLSHFDQLLISGPYKKVINNTMAIAGETFPYYDVHCPIVMNSEMVMKMSKRDWMQKKTFLVKSLYAYTAGLGSNNFSPLPDTGVADTFAFSDRKIDAAWDISELDTMLTGRWIFTTAEQLYEPMIRYLRRLYPERGRWE